MPECEAKECDAEAIYVVEALEFCGWHAGEELNRIVRPLPGIRAIDFTWTLDDHQPQV